VTTAIIAQARMGSSRLPGKVLKQLGGRPVLEHVLTRASRAPGADIVCVATTVEAADDAIASAAESLGFPVFRGSESDVLGRYAGAAEMTKADVIVRITCDCPLIDPGVIGEVLALRARENADYACNVLKNDWPHGLDCEAFTRAALDQAAAAAVESYDREHVTPWIRRNARTALHLPGPGGIAAEQRWVLDYPEDYELLQKVFALFGGAEPPLSWEEVWSAVRKHEALGAINAHLRRPPSHDVEDRQ
jgi:spore coat polysaccharide biosynthesis protein SpsF